MIAAVGSSAKAAFVKKLGADEVICYTQEDMKERAAKITNGHFADVIFELGSV